MKYNTIKQQVEILTECLGRDFTAGTGADSAPEEQPIGSEFYAFIPSWKILSSTYAEAVKIALDALAKSRGKDFHNWKYGQIDNAHLRQLSPRELDGVYAVQLGKKYRGKSVETVRKHYSDYFYPNGEKANREKPKDNILLGAYELAVILLANPGIKYESEYFGIDCAGDEWSYDGDGVFSGAPNFCFRFRFGDGLEFGARDVDNFYGRFGSASGFVPQPKLGTRPLDPLDPSALEFRIAELERKMSAIHIEFN